MLETLQYREAGEEKILLLIPSVLLSLYINPINSHILAELLE